jgi:threonine/homoserine/homoserine lactone efflux protein
MSMPIGPVNAAAISRTLKYSYRYGVAVGVGAAIMDVIYCAGAAQINEFLVESPVINLGFELVGFGALLSLGIHQLRSKKSTEELQAMPPETEGVSERVTELAMKRMNLERKSLFGPLAIGVVLYATNVMAVPEWIIISGLWRSWGVLGIGVNINIAFALGAGTGTLGWFITLTRWISQHHRGFKPATLKKINLGTSIAMLVFAAYFGYEILFHTNWHEVTTHAEQNTGRIIDSI